MKNIFIETLKEAGRKFYAFAVLCVAILATIGGTAYLFYDGHAVFGVTNLCIVAMAFPYIKKELDILLS